MQDTFQSTVDPAVQELCDRMSDRLGRTVDRIELEALMLSGTWPPTGRYLAELAAQAVERVGSFSQQEEMAQVALEFLEDDPEIGRAARFGLEVGNRLRSSSDRRKAWLAVLRNPDAGTPRKTAELALQLVTEVPDPAVVKVAANWLRLEHFPEGAQADQLKEATRQSPEEALVTFQNVLRAAGSEDMVHNLVNGPEEGKTIEEDLDWIMVGDVEVSRRD